MHQQFFWETLSSVQIFAQQVAPTLVKQCYHQIRHLIVIPFGSPHSCMVCYFAWHFKLYFCVLFLLSLQIESFWQNCEPWLNPKLPGNFLSTGNWTWWRWSLIVSSPAQFAINSFLFFCLGPCRIGGGVDKKDHQLRCSFLHGVFYCKAFEVVLLCALSLQVESFRRIQLGSTQKCQVCLIFLYPQAIELAEDGL